MKLVNLLIIASSITSETLYSENILNIEEAARKGYIKLVIKAKGGHTGDVISMKIKNLTSESLSLKVEAGRRLDSQNQEEQDLLVTREERFALGGKQEKTYKIYGMCCQAHNHSPATNSLYSVGKMADSSLIKLATFINENKYYSEFTAQEAVWTVSDNNSIAGINGEKEITDKLQKFVSVLTGRPIPAYRIHYKQQSDTDAMGRAVHVEGVFAYSLNIDNKVTIGIYNSEGKLIQSLMNAEPHEEGEYKLSYKVNTTKLPAGVYYTRMMTDGAVMKEEKIEL
ncbi:MAG: hypothetical protein K0Q95_1162 [Bacteroidota bacterium]|jgi:hypothetical protein|nr:hypothetical protein [Bacteroidota bacterium]